jgi:hypothetical protein
VRAEAGILTGIAGPPSARDGFDADDIGVGAPRVPEISRVECGVSMPVPGRSRAGRKRDWLAGIAEIEFPHLPLSNSKSAALQTPSVPVARSVRWITAEATLLTLINGRRGRNGENGKNGHRRFSAIPANASVVLSGAKDLMTLRPARQLERR